jgi:hypothetical protein
MGRSWHSSMRQCSILLVVGACSALLFLGPAAGAPEAPTVVLYDQYDNQGPGTSHTDSQDFEPANDALDSQAADDFVVPAGQIWSITGVDADGEYDASGPAASVHVYFYANGGGNLPGTLLASRTSNPYANGPGAGDFLITLSSPVVLSAGTYWLSVQARQDLGPAGRWFWHNRTVQSNAGAAWQNSGGDPGLFCSSWKRRNICPLFGADPNPDNVFRLKGTSSAYVVLYDQYDNQDTAGEIAINSQDFEPAYDVRDNQVADDFVVPAGSWTITGVDVDGDYQGGGAAASVHVYFYANGAGNLPGTLVASRLLNPYVNGPAAGDFVIALSSPVMLTAGTYWLSVQARQDYGGTNRWFWHSRTLQSNQGAVYRNPGNYLGSGCTSWIRKASCTGVTGAPDQVFRLGGALNTPTAVRLASLSAKRTPAGVAVSWRTGAETNVLGFDLRRRAERAGPWTKLNARLIRTHGPGSAYRYLDQTARPGIRYAYKLESVRLDGSVERSATIVARA